MEHDDFVYVWHTLKPCDSRQAEYISMKMSQRKKCNNCKRCVGNDCDIYVSAKEEAILGKYLIEQHLNS